jgi:regulatory protein
MGKQGGQARGPRSRKSSGSPAEVRAAALRLLAYRARSRQELIERLSRKGFSSSDIDTTISSLEKSGLVDDEKLAPELLRIASERKLLGRTGIAVFMKKRGLDSRLIEESLMSHSSESELRSARALIEKKLRTMDRFSDDQKRKRLWSMLRRRGFSHDVIRKALPGSI